MHFFRLKKLDLLMLKSFAGPFLVSFGIALFVLIMQFLWLYIDEIAGKGVSILIMIELIGYLSVAVFPMALPIAILISSVMVMGNLSERYELSSMKSAGVSLLRVIRWLVIISFGVAAFSYVCSDFIIPRANLQFKSRLHDIRRTKPTLALEKGIFNEDFRNFIIRIGDKGRDGESIEDVQINDLSNHTLSLNKIMADSGAMYSSDDRKYFVMELYNGTQYQQPIQDASNPDNKYPFIRTNFKSWNKIWNLNEFDMNRTDEDRFKTQRSMLSMDQLRQQIDSLGNQMVAINQNVGKNLVIHVDRLKQYTPKSKPDAKSDNLDNVVKTDSLEKTVQVTVINRKLQAQNVMPTRQSVVVAPQARYPLQILTDSTKIDGLGGFIETFAEGERKTLLEQAAASVKTHRNSIITSKAQLNDRRKDREKTGYELYSKYSFALVCVVFLFIGAPMGAIIRKGGFGYPLLVSISFFMVFIFLTIMCRELAESFILHPFLAAMLPCFVLMPIAAVLTYRSMRDRTMLTFTFLNQVKDRFSSLLARKSKSDE
jgi:lipopolysaccharide export system permease protein